MPRDNAKHNAQRRRRYATDPAYRERNIARSVEYRRQAGKADPATLAANTRIDAMPAQARLFE